MKSFYFDLFYQILFHDCNQYALELRCLCHGWSNLCVRCVENYILQSQYNMFTSVHMKAKGGRKGGSYPNGILSMSSLRDIHFPRKIVRKFFPPQAGRILFSSPSLIRNYSYLEKIQLQALQVPTRLAEFLAVYTEKNLYFPNSKL